MTINVTADERQFLAGLRRAGDAIRRLAPGAETQRLRDQVENLTAKLEAEQGRSFRYLDRIAFLEESLGSERRHAAALSVRLESAEDRLAKVRAAVDEIPLDAEEAAQ
jgi:chromosome segregation ATPase